jgi:phosphoribosyl 1,2-cyclic phosphate phosphodiesterase
MSRLPEEEFIKLNGLKHLTLNTVGYKKHHSHFSLDEALELAGRIGAEHTWLTHLSHTFPVHEIFTERLRERCAGMGISADVRPAYDGLTIDD